MIKQGYASIYFIGMGMRKMILWLDKMLSDDYNNLVEMVLYVRAAAVF